MSQFLVVHGWPDSTFTIMPEYFTSEVTANIHRDHCAAINNDIAEGHSYVVAKVPATLHVSAALPTRLASDREKMTALTDAEVSALARV